MSDSNVALQTEVMLLGWSDTSTRGKTVTFQLPEDSEVHPFKEFAIKSGKTAGQRFIMVLVEIDDNEQIKKHKHKTSQLLHILTSNSNFQHFLREEIWGCVNSKNIKDFNSTKLFLYEFLDIESYSDLDKDSVKRELFEKEIHEPFKEFEKSLHAIS